MVAVVIGFAALALLGLSVALSNTAAAGPVAVLGIICILAALVALPD